jgi:autotransporter-associated beta strand protein
MTQTGRNKGSPIIFNGQDSIPGGGAQKITCQPAAGANLPVRFQNTATYANELYFAAAGAGTNELQVAGNTATFSGNITLNTDLTFSATGTGSFAFDPGGTGHAFALNVSPTLTVAAPTTIAHPIGGAGHGVTKAGAARLTFAGVSTYTGATTVSAGTLLVNGTLDARTSAVTVASGATLGGTGTIARPVTINAGGRLAPGDGAGTLTVNDNLTAPSGSFLDVELGASAQGGDSDLVVIGGAAAASSVKGTINVFALAGFKAQTYTVVTSTGSLDTGGLAIGSQPSGYVCTLNLATSGVVKVEVAAAVSVSSVSPDRGPAAGGSAVTVNGSGFAEGATVTFGGTLAANVVYRNPTQVTCATPAHAAGQVTVVLANPAGPPGVKTNAYTFFADWEADVAPRVTGGDGAVDVSDWIQLGRFAAALDVVQTGLEYQKADCAPKASGGDGQVDVTDWTQAGRYAAALDAWQSAAGPNEPPP